MKTTLELPDDLLTEAKAVALRRRITLRAMVEHALRREIGEARPDPSLDQLITYNQYGFPVMKREGKPCITNEMIYKIMEEEDI